MLAAIIHIWSVVTKQDQNSTQISKKIRRAATRSVLNAFL